MHVFVSSLKNQFLFPKSFRGFVIRCLSINTGRSRAIYVRQDITKVVAYTNHTHSSRRTPPTMQMVQINRVFMGKLAPCQRWSVSLACTFCTFCFCLIAKISGNQGNGMTIRPKYLYTVSIYICILKICRDKFRSK